ncbi:hypothetical protein NFI96_027679 [Prochilodus magdalenae]|nr:hypothetical protein NFI96_027679 [Prochilodus magdalenae]
MKGNTSLKLAVVQTSDEGTYKCLVKSASWYGNITVLVLQVKVHSKVVGPAAPLVVEPGEDLVLPCSLQPNISAEDMMVEWIRLDQTESSRLVHLYEDHTEINNDQMESYRGRTSICKEDLQKGNASLKLLAVHPSDEGAFKCLIRYRSWHDDVTVYVEVKGKSQLNFKLGFHAWKIAIICFSVFAVLFVAFTAYTLKDKFSKKELSPLQCSAVAYMRVNSQYVREKLDMKQYNTSEEGYRRLIPAMTNCKTACLAVCKVLVVSYAVAKTCGAVSKPNYDGAGDIFTDAFEGPHSLYCPLMNKQCFVGCNLTSKSMKILRAVLQTESPSLKELDLSNNDLQDPGVELLSDGLKNSHCKLEILRLSKCNFGEKSCENLGSVLQTETTSLKELDISNNELHDLGVEKLSAGLKSSHCKLEILRFDLEQQFSGSVLFL